MGAPIGEGGVDGSTYRGGEGLMGAPIGEGRG